MTQPSKRLERVFDFDQTILETVDAVADRQEYATFSDLVEQYGLVGGPRKLSTPGLRHSVEYLDLRPTEDYDHDHARLLYTPMGTPIDPSAGMRAMRLFAADPSERLLVIGSPSLAGNTSNRIRHNKLQTVWSGDLDAAVRPAIRALANTFTLKSVDTLGFSYGADAAAQAARVAADYDVTARRGVWIESAAMFDRKPAALLKAFGSSGSELDAYIARVNNLALYQARELSRSNARYMLGMLRASNLAIGHALAMGKFGDRALDALETQDELSVVIGHGLKSELTNTEDAHRVAMSSWLKYGRDRVRQMPLHDMHHAGGDDIDLHAAIMLQGLRMTTQCSE